MSNENEDRRIPGIKSFWVSSFLLIVGFLHNYRALLGPSEPSTDLETRLELAIYDPAEGFPLLALIVFVVLLGLRARAIADRWGGRASWVSGSLLLLVGTSLLVWAHEIMLPDLLMPALVMQLGAFALILGGGALLRVIAIPLLALIIAIPLPAMAINLLVFPLQMITVSLTSFLLGMVGRSYVVAGDLILTHGVLFQVIEGCSGLKSMMSLALAGIAFAEVTGRNWQEKVTLIILAPFLGILANGIRVLILVLREVPPESVEHTIYGLAMMVIGVILLAGTEWVLARTLFARWRRASSTASDSCESAPSGGPAVRRLALVAAFVVSTTLLLQFSPFGQWSPVRAERPINIESLPLQFDGWTGRGIRFDDSLIGSVWFRHRIYRSYERDGVAVRIFVGLEDDTRHGRSGFSVKTGIPRSGWLSVERAILSKTTSWERDELNIHYQSDHLLIHHGRVGYAPRGLELISSWLHIDRQNFGGAASAFVIRLESEIIGDDVKSAQLRLSQFEEFVDDWVQPLGRSGKTRNTQR